MQCIVVVQPTQQGLKQESSERVIESVPTVNCEDGGTGDLGNLPLADSSNETGLKKVAPPKELGKLYLSNAGRSN